MNVDQRAEGSIDVQGTSSPPPSHVHGHHYVSPLAAYFPQDIGPELPAKYRVRRAIGRGAYSSVWTLVNNATGETVVGKLSNLAEMTPKDKLFVRSEAENMRRCTHPNITALIETLECNEKVLFILEYANAGDLMIQIEVRAKAEGGGAAYDEREVLVILAQLCLAVHYLHEHRIMHRDLKSSNVLLTKSGLIKLGDFGFSRHYQESVSGDVGQTFCGTPYYLAPELWQRQSYSYKADIWSLGVILYELLALHKPFMASNVNDLMMMVTRQDSFAPLPAGRYSPAMAALVSRMLSVDPNTRPSIREVLQMPIIRDEALPLLQLNLMRLKQLDIAVKEQFTRILAALKEEL